MFALCNFPAEFLTQKAVPGSFTMKGKETFREGGRADAHAHTQRLQIQCKPRDLSEI